MPAGERKDVLTAAGARGWSCVPLIRPGRVRGIWDSIHSARHGHGVSAAGGAARRRCGCQCLEREFLEDDRARLTTRLERRVAFK